MLETSGYCQQMVNQLFRNKYWQETGESWRILIRHWPEKTFSRDWNPSLGDMFFAGPQPQAAGGQEVVPSKPPNQIIFQFLLSVYKVA